ncbi:MAG: non-homologous end-joining DNA ligase [Acidimicrobiales bacterium]
MVDLSPMKAVSGPVPSDDGWAFEVKWDGMRILAEMGDGVRLTSSNGIDVSVRFPELDGLAAHLGGHTAVLDGEVVAFDDAGHSDFGRLQPRMHAADAAKVAHLRAATPVVYVVFDLLRLDRSSLLDVPYVDRRGLLVDLVEPMGGWMVPAHQVGDGRSLYDAAAAQGLEGIMAKRLDSPYRPGKRSPAWRKCKVRRRQEVVIGGWTPGEGGRSSTLGSLLVGVRDPGDEGGPLHFAGGVGTGFTMDTLADLQRSLTDKATDTCPFDPVPPRAITRHARWTEPDLVAEVAFAEWTGDGRLRHPSYLGLRLDKAPDDVVREPDPGHERTSG